MKYFYKIVDGKLQRGSGYKIPTGFIGYTKGNEPQELLDIIERDKLKAQVEAQQKAFNNAIAEHLDTQCKSLGFTGDETTRPYRAVANYVGFDNVYRVEAEKLGGWIALTFQTAEQIEADVIAGRRPMPTIEEILSELPIYE